MVENSSWTKIIALKIFLICICELSEGFHVHCRQKTKSTDNDLCKTPNVRTELFKANALSNDCWNAEEIGILLSRAIIQNILPKRIPTNMPRLYDYFIDCLETVQRETEDIHVQMLVSITMIDAIGGYLQSYGLPITKRMYYDGNLVYEVVYDFVEMLNTFKTIFDTDGSGWARPIFLKKQRHFSDVALMRIHPQVNDHPCDSLELESYSSKFEDIDNKIGKSWISIPLPILDDYRHPGAVAIPLRDTRLVSINNKQFHDKLLTYYATSIRCLQSTKSDNTRKMIDNFEFSLYKWMKYNVIPRLNDRAWYPAFFGVNRIYATVKRGWPRTYPTKINHTRFENIRRFKAGTNDDEFEEVPPINIYSNTMRHKNNKQIRSWYGGKFYKQKLAYTKSCMQNSKDDQISIKDFYKLMLSSYFELPFHWKLTIWSPILILFTAVFFYLVDYQVLCRTVYDKDSERDKRQSKAKCTQTSKLPMTVNATSIPGNKVNTMCLANKAIKNKRATKKGMANIIISFPLHRIIATSDDIKINITNANRKETEWTSTASSQVSSLKSKLSYLIGSECPRLE